MSIEENLQGIAESNKQIVSLLSEFINQIPTTSVLATTATAPVPVDELKPAVTKTKRKRNTKKAAVTAAGATVATTPAVAPITTPAATPGSDMLGDEPLGAVEVTLDDVKALLIQACQKAGEPPTRAILTQHNVARAQELDPSLYATVVGQFQALINA